MNLELEAELNRVIRRVPGYAHGAVKVAQIKLPAFDSGVCNDKEAAAKLFRLYPHWKHCDGKLFVFDDTTGLWGADEYMHQAIISRYSTHLVLANDDDKYDPNGKSYGNTLSLVIRLPSFMKLLCTDRDWVKDSAKSSIGKLLFKDGVYDGVAKTFLAVRDYPFDPEVDFTGALTRIIRAMLIRHTSRTSTNAFFEIPLTWSRVIFFCITSLAACLVTGSRWG